MSSFISHRTLTDVHVCFVDLQEIQKMFTHYKSIMLSVNLRAGESPEAPEKRTRMNREWSRACTGLQQWDASLRKKLMQCQVRSIRAAQSSCSVPLNFIKKNLSKSDKSCRTVQKVNLTVIFLFFLNNTPLLWS